MSSRNDPRRQVQRSPLDGIGAQNVPIIDPNRERSAQEIYDPYVKDGRIPEKLFTPLGQMIVVQIISEDEQKRTKSDAVGGIIIPETAQFGSRLYVVVAVGPDAKYLKRGDWVLVPQQVVPQVIRYRGVDTLFLHEQQCQAYVDEVREANEQAAETAVPPQPATES